MKREANISVLSYFPRSDHLPLRIQVGLGGSVGCASDW